MGQINQNKRALLVTGTIVPNSNFVAHTDVEKRRQEYIDGLSFYASQFPNEDIYFLENSEHDLAADKEFQQLLKEKNIRLLKFPVSNKFSEGKGYQEFEMLDSAIQKLFSQYKAFIKITGRYKVENIRELVSSCNAAMMADSHKKHRVTQTNVFYVEAAFYQSYLKGLFSKVNDAKGNFIEHVVYEKLVSENALKNVNLFPKNPVITGFSGSYGGTLKRNKYKMMLRNAERILLRIAGIHQFIIEY